MDITSPHHGHAGAPADTTPPIRLGCAALAVRNGRLLLGRSAKGPIRGKWILPGGGVGFGETHLEAVRREFLEETGLVISPRGVAHVADIIIPQADEHRVVIYVDADIEGEKAPRAGSDLAEAGLFTPGELRDMAAEMTPTTLDVLRRTNWLHRA